MSLTPARALRLRCPFPGLPSLPAAPAGPAVAAARGVPPPPVGLSWLTRHIPNTLLVPGTASIDDRGANLAISDVHLDASMIDRLDRIPNRTP